ncbi:MAG: MBL fold metallo-hydrolase [Chloroflexi bacterium]|nr:MBL fold metallo-hydrolase [Chloroflexota bacterium]
MALGNWPARFVRRLLRRPSAEPRDWPTGLIELADGVFAYVQAGGGLCVSNAGLIVGPDGCIVIDALFAPSMTRALREEIARVTDKPVRLLINTHHHIDHTLGNALFPEAQIVSHVNARREQERVGTSVLDRLRPLRPELVAEAEGIEPRLADITFDGELALHLTGRTVRLLHLGTAHTIGDALVLLPDDKLLFAGDVAFHSVTPLAIEGHIGGWLDVCDQIDALDVATIVPGHGPVGGKAELREMRGYLDSIHRQARAAFGAGRSHEEATQGIDLGNYASWTEPERLALNVARLYQEFREEI